MATTFPKKREHDFAASFEKAQQLYQQDREETVRKTEQQADSIFKTLSDFGNGITQDYQTITNLPSQIQSYRMNLQRLQNYGYEYDGLSDYNKSLIGVENDIKNWSSQFADETDYNNRYFYSSKYKNASLQDLDNSVRGLKQQLSQIPTAKADTKNVGNIHALGAGDNTPPARPGEAKADKQRASLQQELNWILANRNNFYTDEGLDEELTKKQAQLTELRKKIADTAGTTEAHKNSRAVQQARALESDIASLAATKDARTTDRIYSSFDDKTKEQFDNYGKWMKELDSAATRGRKWIGNTYTVEIGDVGNTRYRIEGTNSYVTDPEELKYAKAQVGVVDFKKTLRKLGYDDGERESILDRAEKKYNAEVAAAKQQKASEFALNHEVLASLASVPLSLASGVGYLDQLGQYVTGGTDALTGMRRTVDTNRGASQIGLVSTTYRDTIAGELSETGTLGNVASFLYQTAMSIADFITPLGAATAVSKIGKGTEAALKLAGGITKMTTPLLGGAAASQTLQDARARGASDGQALALATMSGIAETLFESVSLDKLQMFQTTMREAEQYSVRELVGDIAKQSIVEASEEFTTTLANTVSDLVIMADKNSVNQSVLQYMAQGYSRDDATRMAWKDWWGQIGLDALGGALSGFAISTSSGAASKITNAKLGNLVFDSADDPQAGLLSAISYVEAALSDKYTSADSVSRKIATHIAENYKGADFATKLPKSEMGRLVRAFVTEQREKALKEVQQPKTLNQQIAEQNQTQTVFMKDPKTGMPAAVKLSPIAEQMIDKGFNVQDAVKVAPVVERIAAGLPITNAQFDSLDLRDTALAETISDLTGVEIDATVSSKDELAKSYRAAIKAQSEKIEALNQEQTRLAEEQEKITEAQMSGVEIAQTEANKLTENARAQITETVNAPEEETLTLSDGNRMTRSEFIQSFRMANPGSENVISDEEIGQMFDNAKANAASNGGVVDTGKVSEAVQSTETAPTEEAPEQESDGEEATAPVEEAEPKAEPKPEPKPETEDERTERKKTRGTDQDARAKVEQELLDEGATKLFDGVFFKESADPDAPKKLTLAQEWSSSVAALYLRPMGVTAVVWDQDGCNGSNAFIDDATGVMRLNPALLSDRGLIMRAIGHEITHPATNDAKGKDGKVTKNEKAEDIIRSVVELYNRGVLRGKLADQVEQFLRAEGPEGKSALTESVMNNYRNYYLLKEMEARAAASQITGDTTEDTSRRDALLQTAARMQNEYNRVDEHFARQEIASDWVGFIFENPVMMEKLAGVQPSLMTRVFRTIRKIRGGGLLTVLNGSQMKAATESLDVLMGDINNAIQKSKLQAFQPKQTEKQQKRGVKQTAKANAKEGKAREKGASAVQRALERTTNPKKPRKFSGRVAATKFSPKSNEGKAIKALGPDAEVTTTPDGELLTAKSEDGSTVVYSLPTYYESLDPKRVGSGRDYLMNAIRDTLEDRGHDDVEIKDMLNGLVARMDSFAEYFDNLADRLMTLDPDGFEYQTLREHLDAVVTTDVTNHKQTLTALVRNGDYPVNLDLALICKQRVAYMRVFSQLVKDGVLDHVKYNGDAIAMVNKVLRDAGFETACQACFVESRRLHLQKWSEVIVDEWNDEVTKRNPNAGYFNFARGGNAELNAETIAAIDKAYGELKQEKKLNDKGNRMLGQGNVKSRMGRLLDDSKLGSDLMYKLRTEDLLTPEGITALRKRDGTLFSLVQSRYGVASPKIVQEFNPYNGELAELTYASAKRRTGDGIPGSQKYQDAAKKELADETPVQEKGESKTAFAKRKSEFNQKVERLALKNYLYDIGGVRIQSFSDFMIENVFDYLQIMADLTAKQLPLHGYSKVATCLKLFGMTGAKWNGSLIAHTDPTLGERYAGLLPVEEASDGRGVVVDVPMINAATGEEYIEKMAICFDDYQRNKRTKGTENESFIQSIGMKDIFALQMDPRYSGNVGSITIGVSDAQIRAMLRSPWFTMVIPYHKSNIIKAYAEQMGISVYNDYTDYQTTRPLQAYDKSGKPISEFHRNGKGETVHADTHYDFNHWVQELGSAKAAAQHYIEWCRDYKQHPVRVGKKIVGYEVFAPKFSDSKEHYDFTQEENYYKLLEDFVSYDSVTGEAALQGAVNMVLPGDPGTQLSESQLAEYETRLRESGFYSEKEIKNIIAHANDTFEQMVEDAFKERIQYHKNTDPKIEPVVETIKERLLNEFPEDISVRRAARAAGTEDGLGDEGETRLSLTSENGQLEMSVEDGEIRYMFAGEKSLLADQNTLQTAKDLESQGKTAEEIFQQTGWFRGADTKWRYEIDDSKMTFHPKGSARIWNDYPDYPSFYELEKRVDKGETLSADEQKRFEELKQKFVPLRARLNKEGRQHIRDGTATLDEVMVHPELFTAYPDLRNEKFKIAPLSDRNTLGEHSPISRRITLNKNFPWYDKKNPGWKPPKDPKIPVDPGAPDDHYTMQSTLLHETQHAVQSIEGFGRGGSPDTQAGRKRRATSEARDLRGYLSSEGKRLFENWARAYNSKDPTAIEAAEQAARTALAGQRAMGSPEIRIFETAMDWFKLSKDPRGGGELYRDLSGEQEARDIQYRRYMTDAQRRRYLPNLGDNPIFADSPIYRKGPTNKTWKQPSGRYSLPVTEQQNTDYMDAVDSGNIRTARQLVEQAAANWGAVTNENGRPIKLYRGTRNFGRTTFQSPRIYTTTNQSVASGYGGPGQGNARGFSKERTIKSAQDYKPDNGDLQQLIKNASGILGADLHIMSDSEIEAKRAELMSEFKRLNDEITDVWIWGDDFSMPEDVANKLYNVLGLFGDIAENGDSWFSDDADEREESIQYFDSWYSDAVDQYNKVRDYFSENRKAILESSAASLFKKVFGGYDVVDAIIDAQYSFRRLMAYGDKLANSSGETVDIESIRSAVEMNKNSGVYSLYGNLGDNPLVVDADGAYWTSIKIDAWDGNHHSTDRIVDWAKENGYTSVVIKNVLDPGISNHVADDYVFWNKNQVKSADLITYGDDGNVIPLSERFNTEEQDIRYSLPTDPTEMDRQYLEAVNSDDTETVQRMVKEAARAAGYDEAWAHGTPNAIFTSFDLSKAKGAKAVFLSDPGTASQYAVTTYRSVPTRLIGREVETIEDALDEIRRIDDGFHQPQKVNGGYKLPRGQMLIKPFEQVYSESDVIEYANKLRQTRNGGVYRLYINPGKKLSVDAKNAWWNRIRSEYGSTTDQIGTWALNHGYDSAEITNVHDGGFNDSIPSDILLVFDANRLKSADPVTYDDDGNIIPLSERFNTEEQDIRYSLTTDSQKQLDSLLEQFTDALNLPRSLDPMGIYATFRSVADGTATNGHFSTAQIEKAKAISDQIQELINAERDRAEELKNLPVDEWVVRQVPEKERRLFVEEIQTPAMYWDEDIHGGLGEQLINLANATNPRNEDSFRAFVKGAYELYKQAGEPFYANGEEYVEPRGAETTPRFSIDPSIFQTPEFRSYYNDLLESRGLTQKAVEEKAAKPSKPRVSNVKTHTLDKSNILNDAERVMEGMTEDDFTYNPDSEIESMQRAKDRLDADFEGEYKRLRNDGLSTNEDVDMSMGILSELIAHARNTGDYSEAIDFLQDIRSSATKAGQFIQAFAKYSRTPEGVLHNAAEALAESNLSKEDQAALLERIGEFVQTLKAIERGDEGDREDLIDLIVQQAQMRNTSISRWTMRDLGEQKIDYLYDAALNQMDQIAKDYIKPGVGKQIATYQTIAHLFNLRTAGRNVVSNVSFNPFAAVANDLAIIPDYITGLFTGRRNVGMDWWVLTPGRRAAKREAGRTAAVELALDIDPRPNRRDKYGTARRTWKMTGNGAARVGSTIEKAMGYELNWTDERHKGGVRAEIERSLSGLVDKGFITEEMAQEWAEQEALYRAFQDDTFPGKMLAVLKRGANMAGIGHTGDFILPGARAEVRQFGAGDLLVKYTQVPGALISRSVEFSPLGYLKALYHLIQMPSVNQAYNQAARNLEDRQAELEKHQNNRALVNRVFAAQNTLDKANAKAAKAQREFALAVGRATTGSGLIQLFVMAAASGLLRRADDEEDKNVKAMLTDAGATGTQFNPDALWRLITTGKADWQYGDHLWAVGFLEPLNSLMTVGFKINSELKKTEDPSFLEKLNIVMRHGTVMGIWDTIGELPVLQTLGSIRQSLEYADQNEGLNKPELVAIDLFRSSVTGFIPGPVRQAAQAFDTVQRDTYTSKDPFQMTLDQIKNGIPGLRNTLPAKLNSYGEPRKLEDRTLNMLNAFAIPGSIRTYRQSEEAKVLDEVAKATGDTSFYPSKSAPYKQTLTVEDEKVSLKLSAEERTQFQTTSGQYLYALHKAMMKDSFFTTATPQEQAAMLSEAKSLAEYMAKQELVKNQLGKEYINSEQERNLGALDVGFTMASWTRTKAVAGAVEGVDLDEDGEADDGTKKKEALQNVQALNLTDEQKAYWFRGTGYNGKKNKGVDKIGDAMAQGISASIYIDSQIKLTDAHGEDANGDGKTDSGSLLRSKAAIINSLPLTAEQKYWLFLQGNSTSTKFANSYTWTDTSGN